MICPMRTPTAFMFGTLTRVCGQTRTCKFHARKFLGAGAREHSLAAGKITDALGFVIDLAIAEGELEAELEADEESS